MVSLSIELALRVPVHNVVKIKLVNILGADKTMCLVHTRGAKKEGATCCYISNRSGAPEVSATYSSELSLLCRVK